MRLFRPLIVLLTVGILQPQEVVIGRRRASAPAFDVSFNYRATLAYVTDPSGTSGSVFNADQYPHTYTMAGTGTTVTAGWESGALSCDSGTFPGHIDVSTAIPILAGAAYAPSSLCVVFRIDLPSAGTYKLHLAAGNANSTDTVAIYDTTTLLSILFSSVAITTGNEIDATGTVYTNANWAANETPVTLTFTSTILRLKLGWTNFDCISHLQLVKQ